MINRKKIYAPTSRLLNAISYDITNRSQGHEGFITQDPSMVHQFFYYLLYHSRLYESFEVALHVRRRRKGPFIDSKICVLLDLYFHRALCDANESSDQVRLTFVYCCGVQNNQFFHSSRISPRTSGK